MANKATMPDTTPLSHFPWPEDAVCPESQRQATASSLQGVIRASLGLMKLHSYGNVVSLIAKHGEKHKRVSIVINCVFLANAILAAFVHIRLFISLFSISASPPLLFSVFRGFHTLHVSLSLKGWPVPNGAAVPVH